MSCTCTQTHATRKLVVTGGPGAGKTALLELVQRALCEHVHVVRESAGVVFGGGFPRTGNADVDRAAQRAIFYVQRELEAAAAAANAALLLCDRGTLDGAAYWPGPGTLWDAVGTTREAQFARYDVVLHLRTPDLASGYNHANPLRIESAKEAAVIDAKIAAVWADHPRRFEIAASHDFVDKATRALAILRDEIPACCAPIRSRR